MSDRKSALAVIAAGFLEDIILERYLIKILPENRQYSLKAIKKLTGHNFWYIRDYVDSDIFTIHKTSIEITEDAQLLSDKSKNYCEKLIKKLVFPSLYEHDEYIYHIGKLFNSTYYTLEEKSFLNFMLDKLYSIINDKITLKPISHKDLLEFNLVNSNGFSYVARNIFNAIIQNKLHFGDDIMPFINHILTDKNEIFKKLESGSKFDCFFTENAILKCDLDTNFNVLVKNFLNLSIYNLIDRVTKTLLLLKLNGKHSFLIRDKVFEDFE